MMAFGLPGAMVSSIFSLAGLQPPDAYAASVVIWLSIAFAAAIIFVISLGLPYYFAVFASLTWLSFPIIWGHAGYSWVSVGIALLPLYFAASLGSLPSCCVPALRFPFHQQLYRVLYPLVCVLAIFMDGYSFVMFAVGSSLFGLAAFAFSSSKCRISIVKSWAPLHAVSFVSAYVLYALYIGSTEWKPSGIDFFRSWGVDLTFIAIPTSGQHWVPDWLGLSVPRSSTEFFGDASTWATTFALPIFVSACCAILLSARSNRSMIVAFFLLTAFAFYMSLGPSLKIGAVKPVGSELGSLMPATYATMETGSAFAAIRRFAILNMRSRRNFLFA